MNKNKNAHYSMTGFIIGLIVISMFTGAFGIFLTQMDAEAGDGTVDNTLTRYQNVTNAILDDTQEIKDSVETDVSAGNIVTDFLDIVGGFFSGGWSAIKTSFNSFRLFNNLMDDAANDVPEFSYFKTYILAIILIIIFVGIGVTVLLKIQV